MTELRFIQVDAFADRPFTGNPAAVMPLGAWLPDEILQAIALENNLAETAFFVRTASGKYDLRWFTPESEVELCGHGIPPSMPAGDAIRPSCAPTGAGGGGARVCR